MKLEKLLSNFQGFNLSDEILRGIERECLRVGLNGKISQKEHPLKLGKALTHPNITTDYSESLLEFVTPTFNDPKKLLSFLKNLHIFTSQKIGDEILWNNSMPCVLSSDDIPIASYGSSNIGKMKEVYRIGLKNRYGSAMQVISGIHFNFSLSDHFFSKLKEIKPILNTDNMKDYKSHLYMNGIRNIHKYSWMIPYFMGSSPVICGSFLSKCPEDSDDQNDGESENSKLINIDNKGTLGYQGATSLRLSNLGYTNSSQDDINISYNSLKEYARDLKKTISTEFDDYKKIDNKSDIEKLFGLGQLNSNILQLENEYYNEARPKQITKSGESPVNALLDRGIEYVELRSVDVNSYSLIGIELDQVLFLDIFILYCLLEENNGQTTDQVKSYRNNQELVARHGRQKELKLFDGEKQIKATDLVRGTLEKMKCIASKLQNDNPDYAYEDTLNNYINKVDQTNLLMSEKIVNEIIEKESSFFESNLKRSIQFTGELKKMKLDNTFLKEQIGYVQKSIEDQKNIEDSDRLNFSEFLKDYNLKNLT